MHNHKSSHFEWIIAGEGDEMIRNGEQQINHIKIKNILANVWGRLSFYVRCRNLI